MSMRQEYFVGLVLGTCVFLGIGQTQALGSNATRDELAAQFAAPPDSARPWTYWFVMDGNLSRPGITADFEAMKRIGLRGLLFMEVDVGISKGPVKFMSPPWRELFKHANEEAARLGLVMTMPASPGWTGSGGPWVKPEQSMQKLVSSETTLTGAQRFDAILPKPETVAGFYRDVAVLAFPTPTKPYRIEDIQEKAVYHRGWYSSQRGVKSLIPLPEEYPELTLEQVVPMDRIVDLTDKLDENGRLAWEVPPGQWTVLRFGHTSTGATTRPAPEPGLGLECDKFDKAALEAHFNEFLGKLLSDIGPLAGRSLISLHIDSWEMGPQNWTARFRDEFRRRRGYDLLRYLPTMTGRVVENLEISERFLWDFRQTILELITENHARHLAELAHQHGLGLSIEPYDQTPCDDMTYGACADVPMGEFWRDTFSTWFSCTEASSIAHTYGKRIVQAEAFTSGDGERWLAHPASLKALGDWAFCEGINRFVFHRYAHQPWLDRSPGMTMGPYGIHYERTQTWWDMSGAWLEYLARCQFMLQQGLFVADVCFLKPEASPQVFRAPTSATRGTPPERLGYNFDGCTPEVLLTRMSVKDGRLVLPDGMRYRVLVLPELRTMTPTLLRKVKDLVAAGATAVGPRPLSSPSLSGFPQCDAEVERLADELWANCDGNAIREHAYGKGRVVWQRAHLEDTPKPWENRLKQAKWIWHSEGNPAESAPVGKRFFRRVLTLPADANVESARMFLTADNTFELWVNGHGIGRGDDFHQAREFDVKKLLQPGVNVVAVAAENSSNSPNPAGLIGTLIVKFHDGRVLEILTDHKWQTARTVREPWAADAVSPDGWAGAMELGPLGMAPWGAVGKPASQPEYYCQFSAIAETLAGMGVPPDFESDGPFRYIHRRMGDTDIYFVANRENRRQHAECAFRVAGKVPQIWDPITGQITRPAVFHEEEGRTYLPLCLESAGSRFIVFRDTEISASKVEPVVAMNRDGRGILPGTGCVLTELPATDPFINQDGRLAMLVRQPGRYELKTAAGDATTIDVESVPASHNVPGPWEVHFQSGRGAPERIGLERLMDWSIHKDPGVKFFSGTATYRTTFDWTPETVPVTGHQTLVSDSQARFFLNLGEVQVMAQVSLNDRDLGVLWKPPYNVDVTDALKSGENILEIKVANLWPNRLIGDKALPVEERVAWTTWNPFAPDTPLLKSGLIGPVTVKAAVELTIR